MKNSIQFIASQIRFALVALLTLGGFQSALAVDQYWSALATTGVATDGAGTWGTAGQWRSSLVSTTPANWVNGSVAIFGANNGSAGTVTLAAGATVNGITFNALPDNYTVTGNTITLGLDPTPIQCDAANENIGSVIAGANPHGLRKTGTGKLTILNNANTYDGKTWINAGTVVVTSIARYSVAANSCFRPSEWCS